MEMQEKTNNISIRTEICKIYAGYYGTNLTVHSSRYLNIKKTAFGNKEHTMN